MGPDPTAERGEASPDDNRPGWFNTRTPRSWTSAARRDARRTWLPGSTISYSEPVHGGRSGRYGSGGRWRGRQEGL